MAEKRMFSSNVIDSDAFLDMSPTARLLYYDMGMRADDDGFIDSPKKIMRIIGASDSDLKELIDNGFVLRFESGVIVIRHWYVNNRVRRDTYHETIYTEEKSRLFMEKNNVYQLRNDSVTDTLQTRDEIGSQIRGGEDRLEEDRLGEIKNSSEQKISSELVPPPNPDECIEFPVLGGSTYIPKSLIDEWESVYTNVDVMQEVLKAKEWCKANPKRLKVNWRSFLVNWLNKNQDRRPMHEEGYRTQGPNRCMEPDKVIEAEEAGF